MLPPYPLVECVNSVMILFFSLNIEDRFLVRKSNFFVRLPPRCIDLVHVDRARCEPEDRMCRREQLVRDGEGEREAWDRPDSVTRLRKMSPLWPKYLKYIW